MKEINYKKEIKKYLAFSKKQKDTFLNFLKKINKKEENTDKKPIEKKKLFSDISLFSVGKFSIKKQTFFAKRLSFLIKAGVPMLESVVVIRAQTKSQGEVKVFDKVIIDISNGQTLATSLGKFRGVFGNFAINLIKAGEQSGTLTQNLAYLADELKKKEMLKNKIIGALMYPIIVTVATFGITGFLAVYIFPKILPIFQSLGAKLPASTRAVIWMTSALKNYGLYIFLSIAIIVTAIIVSIKRIPKVRFLFDGLILQMPLFGKIAKSYNITNTTRTLGLLLKSGISLNEAIHITSDTTDNMQYKKAFLEMSKTIVKGKNMSEYLNSSESLFPTMIGHMVAIGEKSGNLSNTLIYLSEFYENEFEDFTKNLSSAVEPVLMLVMGFMVGFIAISVITPIYEITNNLHK